MIIVTTIIMIIWTTMTTTTMKMILWAFMVLIQLELGKVIVHDCITIMNPNRISYISSLQVHSKKFLFCVLCQQRWDHGNHKIGRFYALYLVIFNYFFFYDIYTKAFYTIIQVKLHFKILMLNLGSVTLTCISFVV